MAKKDSFHIKSIAQLSIGEKSHIIQFICQNSLLNKTYVLKEFLSYKQRDIIYSYDKDKRIRFVLSLEYKTKGRFSYLYLGDLIKRAFEKPISLIKIISHYLIKKEGWFYCLFRPKIFVSCCYNPRSFKLIAQYLKRYSLYDKNINKPIFHHALNQFDLKKSVDTGFYVDKAIKTPLPIEHMPRYVSQDESLNQFFYNNVFSKKLQQYFYAGKSLVVVAHYQQSMLFKHLIDLAKSLMPFPGRAI